VRYVPEELFRSTAPYYARYRPGYKPELIEHLVRRFQLDGTQQVLDLGCGTGQIALPLAPHVRRVVAVDPERGMLAEGRRLAEDQQIFNIDWVIGDSFALSQLELPEFTLVTIGAAFHWMDRDAVLRDLDRLVRADGAVVVARSGPPLDGEVPPWEDTITAVRTRYLGGARRAGSGIYSHPEEGHADVLRRSAFSRIHTVAWTWTLERDLDSIVGLQFSFSYSAPALFDDEEQMAAFECELREALAGQFPSGAFREHVRTEALIATRPLTP
jgi:ubiquinone/menaquinone biosynthesis C-methylase UbiE